MFKGNIYTKSRFSIWFKPYHLLKRYMVFKNEKVL